MRVLADPFTTPPSPHPSSGLSLPHSLAGLDDRLLQVHPEREQVEQELRVSLRLHRAAHQAEAHVGVFVLPSAAAGEPGRVMKPGISVWNGRFPGATVFGSS